MNLVDFLRQGGRVEFRLMLAFAVIAGLANALLIVVVNLIAGLVAAGDRPDWKYAFAFVGIFAIYYQFDKIAVRRATIVIERLLKGVRTDIVDKLRCSELQIVEKVGRGNLYSTVTHGTNQLSVTFPLLLEIFQQAVLLTVSLVYLGYLSVPALVLFLSAMLIGLIGYRRVMRDYDQTLRDVVQREAEMLASVGDIIDGSKELRLSTRRSESVIRSYQKLLQSAVALLAHAGEHLTSISLLGSVVIYFMMGVVGFIFPRYIDLHGPIVYQLIPTLLFCIGPLSKIVSHSPTFVQARVVLNSVLDIQRQLGADGGIAPSQARELAGKYRNFQRIGYSGMRFSFRDTGGEPIFTAGPLDLEVRRGEVLFLVGGNGSGKSTVVRLITGLYRADHGQIDVDGVPVVGDDIAGLREHFSAILADFHLFDRLYGLEQVDPAEVTQLIGEMGLTGKVSYEDGRFTDLRLSTGERKRLALIAALLEDRPIYVFDEWSAEQDVNFREAFYTRIIPGLQAKGKTVLAVTHDDRFWHLADRVIKLDLGTVVWERAGIELADGGV